MNFQNLIDYCEWKNIDIFEGCSVPAPFNMEMVKNEIMKRCGLLQPVYGEPEVFKGLCKMWFDSNQWNFEHLAKVYNASYSPIENVYESDHWVEGHSGTDKTVNGGKDIDSLSGSDAVVNSGSDVDTLSGSDSDTLSGQDTFTHGEKHTESGSDTFTHGETHTLSGTDTLTHGEKHTTSGTDTVTNGLTTEHQVSAYNSSGYQADTKSINSGDDKTTYGKTDTASGDDKTKYGKTDTASGMDTTGYGKVDTASGTDTTGYGKVDTTQYGKVDTFQHGKTETTNYGKRDTLQYGKTEDFTHGHKVQYDRLRHGNIGVTSNNQLINQELAMLAKFNPYDWIAAKFERENFLQIY